MCLCVSCASSLLFLRYDWTLQLCLPSSLNFRNAWHTVLSLYIHPTLRVKTSYSILFDYQQLRTQRVKSLICELSTKLFKYSDRITHGLWLLSPNKRCTHCSGTAKHSAMNRFNSSITCWSTRICLLYCNTLIHWFISLKWLILIAS
jgi:hypothetical protein